MQVWKGESVPPSAQLIEEADAAGVSQTVEADIAAALSRKNPYYGLRTAD
jgi:hypothetical protein